MKIMILNGPNLNRLGKREPEIYGHETLQDVEHKLLQLANKHEVTIDFRQSNHEGELVDWLHEAADNAYEGVVINPAAYTHTSVALHDAIAGIDVPVIEVHISNVHKREAFRHHSYLAPACIGQIVGLGTYGYQLALQTFIQKGESSR
ncbi:MAG TPA: type II 3-dehydroquinate dehydratase [Metalysinibacillus jejuensis]|uniref:3-dehydroquinate dehydratase n=1 Tax=Metalysinibacillus jejuensis TaxID=914327 RepID=A0A921T5H4_9BACL|nr:type II 3-dehydroquinate dehydratase [Metalysinibacillus jejuensis]HJH11089.1 type II 3-dehydroquinate dehydratase [Metalysinibacillus jejuensis]